MQCIVKSQLADLSWLGRFKGVQICSDMFPVWEGKEKQIYAYFHFFFNSFSLSNAASF